MSNENFFIKIYPLNVKPIKTDGAWTFEGESIVDSQDVRRFLLDVCGKEQINHGWHPDYPWDSYQYIKGNTLVLELCVDSRWKHCWELTLIACYSWYEENIDDMYHMFEKMNKEFTELYSFHPRFGDLPAEYHSFVKQIRDTYDEQWLFFQKTYDLHKPLLPEQFNAYIRSLPYLFRKLRLDRRS